jgi:hypothetical protein
MPGSKEAEMLLTSLAEPTQTCPSKGVDVRTDQTERLCRAQHGCHQSESCPLGHRFLSYDLGVLSDASFERES